MNIPIIFEDNNFVVINKPAGLVVHFDGKTKEPSVCDWVMEKYPEMKEVGEPLVLSNKKVVYRPGIVHRIDKETSGVLVLTKNQKSFEYLKNQFKNREIKKIYRAFVYGEMMEMEGIINRPIGRSKSDFRLWSAQRGARGKIREAITKYRVLNKNKKFSYIEIEPKTGRTHQIRTHFKAINYPIVCDKLYAPKQECGLGFGRVALHSFFIEFKNMEGVKVNASAPLPNDFIKAEKILAEY